MYKVMVVEDEKMERDFLCSLISSFDLKIKEVQSADNGESGWELFQKFHPDIVVSDINMPIMNGLDMIEKIRQQNKNTICIVLTAYDYFKYAQRSIRLGVEDFILKPTEKEGVYQSLLHAVHKLDQQNGEVWKENSLLAEKMKQMKTLLESDCFYALLSRKEEAIVMKTMKLADYHYRGGFCMVVEDVTHYMEAMRQLREALEEEGKECLLGALNNRCILFVLMDEIASHNSSFNEMLKRFGLDECNSAIGTYQDDIMGLYTSYEDALYRLNSVQNAIDMNVFRDAKEAELLTFALGWGNRFVTHFKSEQLSNYIRDFCFEMMRFDQEEQQQIITMMLNHLCKEIEEHYHLHVEVEELYQKGEGKDYQNLEIIMIQLFQKLDKIITNVKYQNSSHLMKKAMKYIEKNYHKPISLDDLAQELHVTTFYISKLFMKEENRNFTEIVNDFRIKKAKQLIRENCSFKEVAASVGFGSQSYFTKIFKKKVGMSPKEYRNLF